MLVEERRHTSCLSGDEECRGSVAGIHGSVGWSRGLGFAHRCVHMSGDVLGMSRSRGQSESESEIGDGRSRGASGSGPGGW